MTRYSWIGLPSPLGGRGYLGRPSRRATLVRQSDRLACRRVPSLYSVRPDPPAPSGLVTNHVDFCLDPSDSCLDPGDFCLDPSDSCLDPSDSCLDPGDSCLDPGDSCLDLGDSCLEPGDFFLDPGDSCLDPGDSCLDLGDSCLGLVDFCQGPVDFSLRPVDCVRGPEPPDLSHAAVRLVPVTLTPSASSRRAGGTLTWTSGEWRRLLPHCRCRLYGVSLAHDAASGWTTLGARLLGPGRLHGH